MSKLVCIKLLIIVNICFLEHLLAYFLHFLGTELTLCQKLDRLLNIPKTNKVVLIKIKYLEGVV